MDCPRIDLAAGGLPQHRSAVLDRDTVEVPVSNHEHSQLVELEDQIPAVRLGTPGQLAALKLAQRLGDRRGRAGNKLTNMALEVGDDSAVDRTGANWVLAGLRSTGALAEGVAVAAGGVLATVIELRALR